MAYLEPTECRNRGWFYTVVGVMLFGGGIWSLFDRGSSKIYLGAILVGPYLFFRGVHFLDQYYRYREPKVPRPEYEPPATAALLYDEEIQGLTVPCSVICEACNQEYVYFPPKAAEAQAQRRPEVADLLRAEIALGGSVVAPCPQCGRIQTEMLAYAQRLAPASRLEQICLLAGVFISFFSVLFCANLLSQSLAPAHQRNEDENLTSRWLAGVTFFLFGVALLVWNWKRSNRWDPNTQPLESRLALAGQVSLPRKDYEVLVNVRGASPKGSDSEGHPG